MAVTFLPHIITLLLLLACTDGGPVRLGMVQRDAPQSPISPGKISVDEMLERATERGEERLETLNSYISMTSTGSKKAPLQTADKGDAFGNLKSRTKQAFLPVRAGSGEYLVDIAIGTPPRPIIAILDTGSDLSWTQCAPCRRCYKSPNTIFEPTESATYKEMDCRNDFCDTLPSSCVEYRDRNVCLYSYLYMDMSGTKGILANDTLTLGDPSTGFRVPNMVFGCGRNNGGKGLSQAGGLVGFGRGPQSVVSQLGPRIKYTFSYCLLHLTNKDISTPLFLGPYLTDSANAVFTPLISNPYIESMYYVGVDGVSVGNTRVTVPRGTFNLDKMTGMGGFIVDSGTTFMFFPANAYIPLLQELDRQIKLKRSDVSLMRLELCFDAPDAFTAGMFPSLTIHFKGGANYVMSRAHYMIKRNQTVCAAIRPAMPGSPGVLGNLGQFNFHLEYNLAKQRLYFAQAECATL